MKSNAEESTCIFGASVMLKYIQAVRQEVEGVQKAEDIEAIHRMRVASRRVRAALPLFERCFSPKKVKAWTARIKNITQALGAARDTDVQIERVEQFYQHLEQVNFQPGVRRLLLRLQQKRNILQADVINAIGKMEKSQILPQMEAAMTPLVDNTQQVFAFTPALYRLAFDSIHARLEAMMVYEPIVHQPEKKEELHAMRIAAKRLRYTLETFAALYPDQLKTFIQVMRKLQDGLGEIHDCDVWIVYLPELVAEERRRSLEYYGNTRPVARLIPGILHFQQDRQQARDNEYGDFVKDWDRWQKNGLWDSLRKTIRQPLLMQVDQVYPPRPVDAPVQEEDLEPADAPEPRLEEAPVEGKEAQP